MNQRLLRPIFVLLASFALACGDDEVPQSAPLITAPEVECEPGATGEFPQVALVSVEVSDVDRDLLSSSVTGYINGLKMEGLEDPDGDNRFAWTPPVEFTPPLVCNGEFTLVITASDAGNRTTTETLVVTGK